MKKLLTLCLILTTTFTVKAQALTFEETVNYINEIFKENKIGYHIGTGTNGRIVKGITANKTGKVIIYEMYKGESVTDKFDVILTAINLFDLLFIYSIAPGNNQISALLLRGYQGNNVDRSTVGFFIGASHEQPLQEPLADRLKKALKHLRSLCNRQADPFGK